MCVKITIDNLAKLNVTFYEISIRKYIVNYFPIQKSSSLMKSLLKNSSLMTFLYEGIIIDDFSIQNLIIDDIYIQKHHC